MAGMVDSFNVSVAAGILMHHAVCNRISRMVIILVMYVVINEDSYVYLNLISGFCHFNSDFALNTYGKSLFLTLSI